MRTCYAKCLGDCSQGLSNDHYMAESILKCLGDYHVLSNTSWLPPGQRSVRLPPSALKAKILCGRHNSELASLDDAGLAVCRFLLDFIEGRGGGRDRRTITVPGCEIERWVMKVTIGAMASGAIGHEGKPFKWYAPEAWVRILFGRAPVSGSGLCCSPSPTMMDRGYAVGPAFRPDGHGMAGLVLELMGVTMAVFPTRSYRPLAMGDGSSPEILRPRPDIVTFSDGGGSWELRLNWGRKRTGNRIAFRAQR